MKSCHVARGNRSSRTASLSSRGVSLRGCKEKRRLVQGRTCVPPAVTRQVDGRLPRFKSPQPRIPRFLRAPPRSRSDLLYRRGGICHHDNQRMAARLHRHMSKPRKTSRICRRRATRTIPPARPPCPGGPRRPVDAVFLQCWADKDSVLRVSLLGSGHRHSLGIGTALLCDDAK